MKPLLRVLDILGLQQLGVKYVSVFKIYASCSIKFLVFEILRFWKNVQRGRLSKRTERKKFTHV